MFQPVRALAEEHQTKAFHDGISLLFRRHFQVESSLIHNEGNIEVFFLFFPTPSVSCPALISRIAFSGSILSAFTLSGFFEPFCQRRQPY